MNDLSALRSSLKTMSTQIGILYHVVKIPRMNLDPCLHSYGVWPSDTSFLTREKFQGRSSGCGFKWKDSVLSTIGETLERYAPTFYNPSEGIVSSYKDLNKPAINPSECALYNPVQLESDRISAVPFNEDTVLTWFETLDLTTGENVWMPGQMIYMPFSLDPHYITANTSTGLAAHTNYYKAILTGLYEVIERDSFVITWAQNIVPQKIIISDEIQSYLSKHFPVKYEWHFFDITYDLEVPSIFGICFGEADFGKFVAVGTSTRSTFGGALQKVIQEIAQAIPYFRYLLGEKKDWIPNDDFYFIQDFEAHSILYLKRPDLLSVFDKWRLAKPEKSIELYEQESRSDKEIIRNILQVFKSKNYPVLFKDITTVDIRQLGFFSIKIYVPQLIPLSGTYPLYYYGGNRLFSVPEKMGYTSNDYQNLNTYPHPFP